MDLSLVTQNPFSEKRWVISSKTVKKIKTVILVAVSVICALGFIGAVFMGAPWFVLVSLFTASLIPLFPIGRIADEQREHLFCMGKGFGLQEEQLFPCGFYLC